MFICFVVVCPVSLKGSLSRQQAPKTIELPRHGNSAEVSARREQVNVACGKGRVDFHNLVPRDRVVLKESTIPLARGLR